MCDFESLLMHFPSHKVTENFGGGTVHLTASDQHGSAAPEQQHEQLAVNMIHDYNQRSAQLQDVEKELKAVSSDMQQPAGQLETSSTNVFTVSTYADCVQLFCAHFSRYFRIWHCNEFITQTHINYAQKNYQQQQQQMPIQSTQSIQIQQHSQLQPMQPLNHNTVQTQAFIVQPIQMSVHQVTRVSMEHTHTYA